MQTNPKISRKGPLGIVPVVQVPFQQNKSIDWESLSRLVEDSLAAGADGLLAPAAASECDCLTETERADLCRFIARQVNGRVPFIVGASFPNAETCRRAARLAEEIGAWGFLVAVPEPIYKEPEKAVPFFQEAASGCPLPMILQDLQWHGYGLPLDTLFQISERVPTLAGVKIETVPAGPKYTAVRERLGNDFYICGGWAVPQMIEALDRGVDAMIPECSMVRVYKAVERHYRAGDRAGAQRLFQRLLPILAFSNQELNLSIAFFKRLLVRRSIFSTAILRREGFAWDSYNQRIADECIETYLELERSLPLSSID